MVIGYGSDEAQVSSITVELDDMMCCSIPEELLCMNKWKKEGEGALPCNRDCSRAIHMYCRHQPIREHASPGVFPPIHLGCHRNTGRFRRNLAYELLGDGDRLSGRQSDDTPDSLCKWPVMIFILSVTEASHFQCGLTRPL